MNISGVHFSSKKTDCATPPEVFNPLNTEFGFKVDVCATAENAKCPIWWEDSLNKNWSGETTGPCWMNPPYGRQIGNWLSMARYQANRGLVVVCLVPARTDTKWWHDIILASKAEIRFIKGRIKFVGAKYPAPFPSAVVIFRKEHV